MLNNPRVRSMGLSFGSCDSSWVVHPHKTFLNLLYVNHLFSLGINYLEYFKVSPVRFVPHPPQSIHSENLNV